MRALAALTTGLAVGAAVAAIKGLTFTLPVPRPRKPRWLLVVEDHGVTATQFLVSSVAAGVSAFVVVGVLTGAPMVAIVPAAVVASLPTAYYHRSAQQADKARLRAWPDALRALAGALSAGSSLHDGCVQLAHTGPVPLRSSWARYEELAKIMRPADAFEALRIELAHPVSDQIFEVLAAASEEGSRNVVQILEDIAASTTASVQLAERIETQRVQNKLNARAVFIVPWLTLIFLASRQGAFRDYYSSPDAVPVLLLCAAMSLGGMATVNRLSHIPEQPRVLTGARKGTRQ